MQICTQSVIKRAFSCRHLLEKKKYGATQSTHHSAQSSTSSALVLYKPSGLVECTASNQKYFVEKETKLQLQNCLAKPT